MTNQKTHHRGGAASISLKKAIGTLLAYEYFLADIGLLVLVACSSAAEGLR